MTDVIISGGTGLVGSELTAFLAAHGANIRILSRQSSGSQNILWPTSTTDHNEFVQDIEHAAAVIHLAGSSIAQGRWSPAIKESIRRSRIDTTKLLVAAFSAARERPKVLLCASAVGFYGDRADERLEERSSAGTGFLPSVCQEWESAACEAENLGVRVVLLRFGVILDSRGGALSRMLPAFRFGLGGKIGSGSQFMSWISLHDAVRAIDYCLSNNSISGPVNVVSPNPVPNAEFTRALAKKLHRPALCHVPAFILRAALGELAQELLLSSCRAVPAALLRSGFTFRDETIGEAFDALLS